MFNVNDCIMYGMTGVCRVKDIKKEKVFNNEEKEYYVLTPIYSKNTIIKIPVDNEKIQMRKMLCKEEIASLICDMPSKEAIWIEDEKSRKEQFKKMVKSGECEELITVIKSIYLNKKSKRAIGKKICRSDEEIMQTAEKLLNEEFAFALDISPKEVPTYIKNHVS